MARHDYLGRRRFRRLKNKYLVCFRVRRGDGCYGHYDSTLTQNISAGGMNFIIDQELAAGTELDMTLRCPIFPGKAVPVRGVVVHIRPDLLGQKLFKTRVRFISFDPLLLGELNRYIDQAMTRREGTAARGPLWDRRKRDRRNKPRR